MLGEGVRLLKDSQGNVSTMLAPFGKGVIMTFDGVGEPVMREPQIREIVGRNLLREPGQTKDDIDDLVMHLEMSYGCLSMVHDVLRKCGVDTSDLPPMFYEEGLIEAIQRKAKELADKELASIGAFPGIAATHKYIAVEKDGKTGYARVPAKPTPKRPRRRAVKNAASAPAA